MHSAHAHSLLGLGRVRSTWLGRVSSKQSSTFTAKLSLRIFIAFKQREMK